MARKYSSNNSGKGITAIMIAIIAVVLALGIFAVYRTVATTSLQNKLDTYSATIAQRADAVGMETEDFLSLYGLSDSGLKGSDNEQDAYEKMTLGNYVKFNSGTTLTEEEFNEFKEATELEEDVTMDTTDMTVKVQYASYVQQQQEEAQAAEQAAQELEIEPETDDDAAAEAEAE